MQQETTVTDLATTNTQLTPAGLQALGLQEQDIPQIKAVAALIQAENPLGFSVRQGSGRTHFLLCRQLARPGS